MRGLSAIVVLVATCLSVSAPAASPKPQQVLGPWSVQEFEGAAPQAALSFALLNGGDLVGNARCVGIAGHYEISNDILVVTDLQVRALGCAETPTVAQQNAVFVAALSGSLEITSWGDREVALSTEAGQLMVEIVKGL